MKHNKSSVIIHEAVDSSSHFSTADSRTVIICLNAQTHAIFLFIHLATETNNLSHQKLHAKERWSTKTSGRF